MCESSGVLELSNALGKADLAAPGDGRTPVPKQRRPPTAFRQVFSLEKRPGDRLQSLSLIIDLDQDWEGNAKEQPRGSSPGGLGVR